MKVLLTLAPAWSCEYPYLGAATICGTLRDNDIDCKFYDLNIIMRERARDNQKFLWEANNYNFWTDESFFNSKIFPTFMRQSKLLLDEIESYKPDVLAFSLLVSNHLFTKKLVQIVKKKFPDLTIICGGPEVNKQNSKEIVEQWDISAAFYGDSEENIIKYFKNTNEEEIPGICYRSNGKIIHTDKIKANLNNTAFPNFDDLDLTLYDGQNVLPINFSKGCIASCCFCNESRYNDTFRFRNSNRIIEEIEKMQKLYHTTHFNCIDSLINGNLKLLKEI